VWLESTINLNEDGLKKLSEAIEASRKELQISTAILDPTIKDFPISIVASHLIKMGEERAFLLVAGNVAQLIAPARAYSKIQSKLGVDFGEALTC
jgi:hypothetical protein